MEMAWVKETNCKKSLGNLLLFSSPKAMIEVTASAKAPRHGQREEKTDILRMEKSEQLTSSEVGLYLGGFHYEIYSLR